jgi:guanylate kinase
MRPGEKEGVDYHFVSETEFERMVGAGEFLEHAEVFGRRYGTPVRELDLARTEGKDLLLEIDVQGAAQVRRRVPGSVSIFVVPESPEELERRLRGRRTETEEAIRRRLDIAKAEVAEMSKYDYLVTNDEVDAAAERLRAIVAAERCRPGRTGAFRAWKRMTSTS